MKLHRLTLRNFRIFRGEQTVDFSNEEKRNITIIFAGHGLGKTTLVNAIRWALFGYSGLSSEFLQPSSPLFRGYNKDSLSSDALPPEVSLKISIGEKSFEVTRRHRPAANAHQTCNSEFTLTYCSGLVECGDAAEKAIQALIPQKLYQPFILTGNEVESPFRADFIDHLIRCIDNSSLPSELTQVSCSNPIVADVITEINQQLSKLDYCAERQISIRINQNRKLAVFSERRGVILTEESFGSAFLWLISLMILNLFRSFASNSNIPAPSPLRQSAPLILDSPFSMLELFSKQALCEALARSPHQSILLIHPLEYDNQAFSCLDEMSRIGSIYSVRDMDNDTGEIFSGRIPHLEAALKEHQD